MRQHTRRQFLSEVIHRTAAVGTGLMVLDRLLGLAAKAQLPPAMTQDKRTYTAGKFAMELDGQFAGWIQSASGGNAASMVVPEAVGSDQIQRKHIAGVKYEDITINCGTGMSKSFYEWIKASFDNKQPVPKNAAILACDYDCKVQSRMEVFNALLTEVVFPACDAASKDAAKMTIRLAPEYTRVMAYPSGGPKYQVGRTSQPVQKKWLPANFRLKIDGLDCTQVRKVEAVTANFASGANQVGIAKLESSMASRPPLPNLVVTVPESRELSLWYEEFVVRGNSGQSQGRGGTLEYLTPLKESLFSLSFRNLGILKLTRGQLQAGGAITGLVRAEMYCSDVRFDYSPSAWA